MITIAAVIGYGCLNLVSAFLAFAIAFSAFYTIGLQLSCLRRASMPHVYIGIALQAASIFFVFEVATIASLACSIYDVSFSGIPEIRSIAAFHRA